MPYLQVRLTSKLERVYDVTRPATIGRAPESTVQILSRAVSRKHATIEPAAGGALVIKDLGAGNGVKVNGKKIARQAALADGDTILVGDITMTYRAASLATSSADTIDLRNRWLSEAEAEAAVRRPTVAFLVLSAPEHREAFQAQIARRRFARLDFSDDEKFKLAIALAEAIENGARHGCAGDPTRPLQVTFEETDDEFVMKVRDLGNGFDVDKVLAGAKQLDALAAIREREQLGPGLGIGIILDCVDRVQFEGRGSCIHMAKLKAGAEMIVIEQEDGASASDMGQVEQADPMAATEPPSVDDDAIVLENVPDDLPVPDELDPIEPAPATRDGLAGAGSIDTSDLLAPPVVTTDPFERPTDPFQRGKSDPLADTDPGDADGPLGSLP